MNRQLKPRPSMVVRASLVSQETSFALLGIVGRKFLESIAPRCERVTRIGKTVLVELDEAERVIRELSTRESSGDSSAVVPDDAGQPRSVDDVLARLGRERAS